MTHSEKRYPCTINRLLCFLSLMSEIPNWFEMKFPMKLIIISGKKGFCLFHWFVFPSRLDFQDLTTVIHAIQMAQSEPANHGNRLAYKWIVYVLMIPFFCFMIDCKNLTSYLAMIVGQWLFVFWYFQVSHVKTNISTTFWWWLILI